MRAFAAALVLLLAACGLYEKLPPLTFPQYEQAKQSVEGGIGRRYEDQAACRKVSTDAKSMIACMDDKGYGYIPRTAEVQATECWRLRDANETNPLPEALCFVRANAQAQ